jgi:hypothetical protein
MKLALEALELAKRSYGVVLLSDPPQDAWKTRGVNGEIDKSITFLRQAIAEASQNGLYREGYRNGYGFGEAAGKQQSKHEWIGLTDEEIFETHKQVDSMQYLTFGKAIEAKLKEKNA